MHSPVQFSLNDAAFSRSSSSKIQLRFASRRYCTLGIKQRVDRSGIMADNDVTEKTSLEIRRNLQRG